jgi:hypothetical protein
MSRSARFVLSAATVTSIVALLVMLPSVAAGGSPAIDRASRGGSGMTVVGRSAIISTPLNGNLQVYGGKVKVRSVVHGDVTAFGGDVSFERDGRVDGNLVYAGGHVTGAEGRVGGHVYSFATVQGAAATMTNTAVVISLLFVWVIVAIVVTLLAGRELRFSSVEVRVSPLYCFALGLVAFTSFVITAIVFSYLVPFVIGIPLLAALAVFAILTKVYGLISVFHAVGTLVAGSRTRAQLASRHWLRGDLAMVVIGVVILGAIRLIPVVGTIVWSCASVFGIGCALATKFGRREPAFLAWRPAEA